RGNHECAGQVAPQTTRAAEKESGRESACGTDAPSRRGRGGRGPSAGAWVLALPEQSAELPGLPGGASSRFADRVRRGGEWQSECDPGAAQAQRGVVERGKC